MTNISSKITVERLLAETDWVRRLASRLVRGEANADDLAQDTLAVALRRPSGWLAQEVELQEELSAAVLVFGALGVAGVRLGGGAGGGRRGARRAGGRRPAAPGVRRVARPLR